MFLNLDAVAPTLRTRIDLAIRTPTTLALLADLLFLELEFRGVAVVEIAKGNAHTDFHVGTASLPASVPGMAPAAEEAREEIEGVVVPVAAAALLALFEAFVAVLVVDFAGFWVGEGFVCFCYFDEFL